MSMVIYLTEIEKKIFDFILAKGRTSHEELCNAFDRPKSFVASILDSLEKKGLIKSFKVEVQKAVLTRRGEDLTQLPEDLIYESLSRKVSIDEIKGLIQMKEEDFNAGIAWGLRRGLFKIITENGKKFLVVGDHKDTLSNTFFELKKKKEMFITPEKQSDFLILKERQIVQYKTETKIEVVPNDSVDIRQIVIGQPVLTHEMLVTGNYKNLDLPTIPLSFSKEPFYQRGKKHFYIEFLEIVKEILISMGFEEMFGPYVEYEFWNFDALFVPQDHPAREVQDKFNISNKDLILDPSIPPEIAENVMKTHLNGWKTGSLGWRNKWEMSNACTLILRSHTTAVSIRKLAQGVHNEFKYFTIDRNFRRDAIDATHLPEFHQCEGIIGGEGLNLKNLFGILEAFSKSLGVEKIRFKPGYFPFTEPSVEAYIYHDKLGWIEAAPGGIFRPEVTLPLGIKVPVLAWGIGITRFAMVYYNLSDIRELFSQNLDSLLLKEEVQIKFAHNKG
ncbi:hypothetical protein B9Q11_00855 [Candidatus Marsarchaeota G2 archaeon ECH_B_SAG-F08]|jgi:phenylalanyl-tRNA synthetase alpha chain|uniref:phenylalanine--tRNA ligase n=3 Tax=Candidatus Marsarchaeota TaxID=1978152 RepID=A0A2R6AKI7_9ARCH|nr:MAG: hypothetical protein B9Q02_00225 [Candidatus Marsarchaeota G1 archaeon BE_D]PSN99455.1 MAG: hypothetical protein B9Q11_00855 [Candidatus Marsarchaeota G2 archaeon ECH_B_SAG-F08]PSO03093.1 MAG: hypothetical protein B9Q10_00600 [Candidatus Marsarchaeota G2 archaeon ECH_B_SAG-E12]